MARVGHDRVKVDVEAGGSLIAARFFLIAAALPSACGTSGIASGVPVLLNSESFSRFPGGGCVAGWANACDVSNNASADTAPFTAVSMVVSPVS